MVSHWATVGLATWLFAYTTLGAAVVVVPEQGYEEKMSQFKSFKNTHKKSYESPLEESSRFENFVTSLRRAAELEAANPHATFGINKFSDMSEQEFASRYFNHGADESNLENTHRTVLLKLLPDTVEGQGDRRAFITKAMIDESENKMIDWRFRGAVTHVRDQGLCAGSFAFSLLGNIEGQWALAGQPLTPLSAQHILSCDIADSGCRGGSFAYAAEWLLESQRGIARTESSYPYNSSSGKVPACFPYEYIKTLPVGATINGYTYIDPNLDALRAFVYAKGPVAVTLDPTSLRTYKGGILSDCTWENRFRMDALVVGFDDVHNPPYWIVKNSWGSDWGEGGYVRISKATRDQCSIQGRPMSARVYVGR